MTVSVHLMGLAVFAWSPTARLLAQIAVGFVVYTTLVVAWRVPGISELEALLARRPLGGPPAAGPTSLRPLDRWRERVRLHGVRAVVDLRHRGTDLAKATEAQWRAFVPHLQAELRGGERMVLDLGCGPGRYTPRLAGLIHGHAIGVEPLKELLDVAARDPAVSYVVMGEGQLPLQTSSIDVVWVCLVLGGIRGETLQKTVDEILRVLRPGGLLFVAENTTEAADGALWSYRSIHAYQTLFAQVRLAHLHDFVEFGERISIVAGRKPLEETYT
jgi:SAM-dependent methyltransferase